MDLHTLDRVCKEDFMSTGDSCKIALYTAQLGLFKPSSFLPAPSKIHTFVIHLRSIPLP